MKQEVKIDQADYTVFVLIRDTSGNAKDGLVFNSAGMDVSYTRAETDNDVTVAGALALVDLVSPALTDPHLDWGFLEVDATKHPGLYRLDIADEVFATGAWSAVVTVIGTGLEPSHLEFVMKPESPYSEVIPPSVAQFNARTIVSADYVVVGDTIAGVTSVGVVTGNVNGSVGSVTGAVGSVTGAVGSVTGSVGSVVGAVGSVTGSVGSVVGAVGSVTGAVGSVTAAVTLTGATIDSIWDELMEAGATARQSLTISNAFHAGITNGGGTATINFRDLADSVNRIRMTGVNVDGNRTGVTLSL